jgi:transposase
LARKRWQTRPLFDINRVQKALEDTDIKLGSVVSDIMGVQAREMLDGIILGKDAP